MKALPAVIVMLAGEPGAMTLAVGHFNCLKLDMNPILFGAN